MPSAPVRFNSQPSQNLNLSISSRAYSNTLSRSKSSMDSSERHASSNSRPSTRLDAGIITGSLKGYFRVNHRYDG